MKAESLAKALEVAQNSGHTIDEYHQRFMSEVCESGQNLELLVDLDRTKETGMRDEG